jgi:hypothetical protein
MLLSILILACLIYHLFRPLKEGVTSKDSGGDSSNGGGSSSCALTSAGNEQVWTNAGTIKEQINIVNELQTKINSFTALIEKNATAVAKNKTLIQSTTANVKSAAKAKETKMNKAAGDMDSSSAGK